MRVLQIGSDRSKRGILYLGTPAHARQEAYAEEFGELDIVAFSRRSDGAKESATKSLRIIPTNSSWRFFYGFDALHIAKKLPRPDVVSAQDPFETGFVAWLIARRFSVPLHVQVHTDFLAPEYIRHSFVNRIRRLLAKFVLKRAARVRVVSERIRESFIPRFSLGMPITVLPIFVDIEKYKYLKSPSQLLEKFAAFKTKLLVIARLEPEKNIVLALRAFAVAAPQDACLIVVGDGGEHSRLEQVAHELNVSDRVFFEGEKQGTFYYPIADLVLVPSKYEGYGLVIIEALAAGKPVLATDVGVAREAGAIITGEKDFANELAAWFRSGPPVGVLKAYPYADFDAYVRAYCDDIAACTKTK